MAKKIEENKRETKEEMLHRLTEKYNVQLPWELDDALFYAQLQYPETTEDELRNFKKK
jgi:ribosomal 50S subunit-associated protein YjgA (DUF615 family)